MVVLASGGGRNRSGVTLSQVLVAILTAPALMQLGTLARFLEVVTNPWFGDNILGLSWVWLYLVTQMPDIDA